MREADGMHCEIEPEVREPGRRMPGGRNWPEKSVSALCIIIFAKDK